MGPDGFHLKIEIQIQHLNTLFCRTHTMTESGLLQYESHQSQSHNNIYDTYSFEG